jgi:hypothetical protein
MDKTTTSVLIAPLNWGLGHATRCVPIIRKQLVQGERVVIAADGDAFLWLQKEFPKIKIIRFPGISIRYSSGNSQVIALLRQLPKIVFAVFREHEQLKKIIEQEKIDRVISDNRFGLWNKSVKCIYITHQLMIKAPNRWMEWLLWRLHRWIICRYDECWIPDIEGEGNLSGDLSHRYPLPRNAIFISWLSRFPVSVSATIKTYYNNLCLLSGPEPHRTLFEQKMTERFKDSSEKTLIVRGKPDEGNKKTTLGNIDFVADLTDDYMEAYLLDTPHIFCRSGYSTLMDLKVLNCKATLFPTPGQTEQEYLAILHR